MSWIRSRKFIKEHMAKFNTKSDSNRGSFSNFPLKFPFESVFFWPLCKKFTWKFFTKKALYLSLKVFSTKVLIGDIFTSPSEPREDLTACSAKGVPSFLSYLRTLSIGPAPGIKRFTDWANSAAVKTPDKHFLAGLHNRTSALPWRNLGRSHWINFPC